MMSQVESFIDFDEEYILEKYDETEVYYKSSGQNPKRRPWSFGECVAVYLKSIWIDDTL